MIALAVLFIVIIGLLLLVVRLLQLFFKTYSSLDESNWANANHKENVNPRSVEINQEINTFINKRLTEMEQKFPAEQTQNEAPEMLTYAFKQVLRTSLKLLKQIEYGNRL
ncbi:MAG: hypothetical protein KDC97_12525 [Confluentibacter sp.]|nr:hypothetical protein [Confluentibacter sp.]